MVSTTRNKTPTGPSPDLWQRYEERAAIKEYCGGMSREEAERQAWEDVMGARYLKQMWILDGVGNK